jgi:hypothetical protein
MPSQQKKYFKTKKIFQNKKNISKQIKNFRTIKEFKKKIISSKCELKQMTSCHETTFVALKKMFVLLQNV